MSASKGWIGVDLDGTLAHHDGWKGHTHVGEPIPRMAARVKGWLKQGRDVRIFTARVDGDNPVEETTKAIQDWTHKHFGKRLPVTNVKDKDMEELWDDRAVGVVRNTGERADADTTRTLYDD